MAMNLEVFYGIATPYCVCMNYVRNSNVHTYTNVRNMLVTYSSIHTFAYTDTHSCNIYLSFAEKCFKCFSWQVIVSPCPTDWSYMCN